MKRCFDIFASLIGLLILAPLLLILALFITLGSSGGVFFRQERVGQYGRLFRIHKFRTMVADAPQKGLQITAGHDARITPIGHYLRRYKLDELPQLIDVLLGKMSIVGPRPEVPKYVACYPEPTRQIIAQLRPGITDLASIEFRHENEILAGSDNPEKDYIEKILPIKLKFYVDYAQQQSLGLDLKIIWKTVKVLLK